MDVIQDNPSLLTWSEAYQQLKEALLSLAKASWHIEFTTQYAALMLDHSTLSERGMPDTILAYETVCKLMQPLIEINPHLNIDLVQDKARLAEQFVQLYLGESEAIGLDHDALRTFSARKLDHRHSDYLHYLAHLARYLTEWCDDHDEILEAFHLTPTFVMMSLGVLISFIHPKTSFCLFIGAPEPTMNSTFLH